jgi:type II secretory pathway predicted ATPase ExeA
MYYDYFGLNQPPFRITPDTNLFFPGGDRGAILDALIYAIVSGEGIVKLVGEVGSGKTTLCRMLEKELPENVEIVYLANPSLSPENILHAIAFELDLKVKPDDSRLKVMNSLQNYLLERHAENRQVVVFVEEAQSMPIATLEEIRLLSNLETAQNKLLQIVIFGQPELDVMIAKPEIRQLKERITYSFYLSPFKQNEIKEYINSRLRSCGYRSVELFNDKAIKSIAKYSNGLLRRINILADKSLLASYADNSNTVSAKHVKMAARETEFVDVKHNPFSKIALIGFSLVFITIMIFIFASSQQLSSVNNNANTVESDSISVVENDTIVSNSSNSSLMLVKDVRESEVATSNVIDESMLANEKSNVVTEDSNNTSVNIDDNKIEEEVFVARPDPSELEATQWQSIKQDVYIYPDEIVNEPVYANVNDSLENSEFLKMQDLMKTLKRHGEDDLALLNQLAILPSETAVNHNAVASDMTCKLCSTIIYRPLKEDKKL